MIRYSEVNWSTPGVKQNRIDNNIEGGKPLAFIINSEVVETMATDRWFSDFMETVEEFRESSIPQDGEEYYVDLIKNNEVVETLACDEMIYSILLSNARAVGYTEADKYAEYIIPGWKYINGEFVVPGEME
jgi:hypothetical protein